MNYYPGMQGCWVGVAFRHGCHRIGDQMIMATTWGGKVHAEFLVGVGPHAYSYSAFDGPGFVRSSNVHAPPDWTVLALPVWDVRAAHAMVLQAVASRVQYNNADLWQCAVKAMLPFESELDCQRPESWAGGVFCSQACLLLLRRMIRAGIAPVPAQLRLSLESVHSRGCSPNTLFGIMAPACVTVY